MPEREGQQISEEAQFTKEGPGEGEDDKIPLTRCPPPTRGNNTADAVPVASPISENSKTAPVAVAEEIVSVRPETDESDAEETANKRQAAAFAGRLLALGAVSLLFIGFVLILANKSTTRTRIAHTSDSQASAIIDSRDDRADLGIDPPSTPQKEVTGTTAPQTSANISYQENPSTTRIDSRDPLGHVTDQQAPKSLPPRKDPTDPGSRSQAPVAQTADQGASASLPSQEDPVDSGTGSQDRVAQTTDQRDSESRLSQEDSMDSGIGPQSTPKPEPIDPESLFAYKLIQARSEYNSAIEKPKQPKQVSSTNELTQVNYQYIHSLESAQRALRPGTGLHKAYSKEIALARQYASRAPYIIDIEALARANPASRLSPYRKAYAAKARALMPSRVKTSGNEKEAAVELILEAKEVIAEIRDHYSNDRGDPRALGEELRLLERSIPKDSANFKTLRSTIQSLKNELLEAHPDESTDFGASLDADPGVETYLLSPETPPPHGSLVNRSGRPEDALITLSTGKNASYLIKLVNTANNRYEVGVFLDGPCEYLTFVPNGTYEIQVAHGTTWFGEKELFGPNTAFRKLLRQRRFAEGQKHLVDLDFASEQRSITKDAFMTLE